ncbi:MAG: hypothetical protein AB7G15_01865 [Alphaproteobacteria bacterium]
MNTTGADPVGFNTSTAGGSARDKASEASMGGTIIGSAARASIGRADARAAHARQPCVIGKTNM